MSEEDEYYAKDDNTLGRDVMRRLTSPVMENDGHHLRGVSEVEVDRNPIDILKDYEVGIRFLDKGCLVNVGCKSLAFNTTEEMLEELKAYINSPSDTTKKYY